MKAVMISKYLSYDEATKSPNALRLGISNEPNPEQLANMKFVAAEIFDPVREFVDGPLLATSFFRSKELNAATPGSSKTSQHCTGEAVDIDADGYQYGSNLAIFDFIRSNLIFDQCISEYPDRFGIPSWVHVSKKKLGNRGQVLVKLRDKYIDYKAYSIGMV